MNKELPMELDDSRFELENRVKNLLWTVSGDYGLDMKPDVSLFLRSEAIALYDGIKPVSYTHLDVYKRQGLYHGRKQ